MQSETTTSPALTLLSEEETMFRDAVAAFAEEEVRPRVMEMEKAGKIDPDLLPKYFELGLMGIEVPEQYGGAGGNLFMLAGHIDEIGVIVNYIDDQGYAYIQPIGGWDPQVLIGQRLRFIGRDGDVFGVVGKKPIHLIKPEEREKAAKFTELWVDLGFKKKEEATKVLSVGDAGVIDSRAMELLIKLPGVGRKTANVILGNAFRKNEGVVVDTHVGRLSARLGLTSQTDPVKIEQELMPLFPQEDWAMVAHVLIFHGRRVCFARSPQCSICSLSEICPSSSI